MLPKKSRLRARGDFERVFRRGKSLFLGEILCLWQKNTYTETKIGVAFESKIFRRSAIKHLYKRKIFEALRPNLDQFPQGFDLVLLFQKKFPGEKFHFFEEKAKNILHQINQVK